jgi:hypothetical protein
MTPKEKAEELYANYYNRIEHCLSEEASKFEKDIVKQCALIAVDEIYKLTLNIGQHLEEFEDKANYYSYWEEVKEELKPL